MIFEHTPCTPSSVTASWWALLINMYLFFFFTQMGVKLQTTDCLTRCQKFPAGARAGRCGFHFPFRWTSYVKRRRKFKLYVLQEASATINSVRHQGSVPRLHVVSHVVIHCWEIDFPGLCVEACLRYGKRWRIHPVDAYLSGTPYRIHNRKEISVSGFYSVLLGIEFYFSYTTITAIYIQSARLLFTGVLRVIIRLESQIPCTCKKNPLL